MLNLNSDSTLNPRSRFARWNQTQPCAHTHAHGTGNLSDTEIFPENGYDFSDEDSEDEESEFPDVWNVVKEGYAFGPDPGGFGGPYGACGGTGGNDSAFRILGTSADDPDSKPHVLSPPLMESLQAFLPDAVCEDHNYWMRFSLVRDGSSLTTLSKRVRGADRTLLAVETVDGEVFGCFTGTGWRRTPDFYGNGEAFLWRMRRPRRGGDDDDDKRSILDQAQLESELDVYPWSGRNYCVQSLRADRIALGAGNVEEDEDEEGTSPTTDGGGGFGLCVDADLLRGSTAPCATFGNDRLARLCEDGVFEVANLEMWTLTPCQTEEEAERLELSKLFIQEHAQ